MNMEYSRSAPVKPDRLGVGGRSGSGADAWVAVLLAGNK